MLRVSGTRITSIPDHQTSELAHNLPEYSASKPSSKLRHRSVHLTPTDLLQVFILVNTRQAPGEHGLPKFRERRELAGVSSDFSAIPVRDLELSIQNTWRSGLGANHHGSSALRTHTGSQRNLCSRQAALRGRSVKHSGYCWEHEVLLLLRIKGH